MTIVNIEIYSIIILLILLIDYVFKFHKKMNTASLLWLALTISTILISVSNIFLTLSDIYLVKLFASIFYFLSTLVSSLFVYIYIKYTYINFKIDLKKEIYYILSSIIICVVASLLYLFFSGAGYVIHSFDKTFINKILILAIIPNITIFIQYIIRVLKNKLEINYKLIFTILLTIIGLILDIKNKSLFFVSSIFTLTALIFYITKHERLLNTDPLTGLANKRGLEAFVLNLKKNLTIAVYNIDVDKFKNINDTYGHLEGDFVLKTVAKILRNSSREEDLVIRNGGDEFLILAKVNTEKDAQKIIKRINSNLNSYNKKAKIRISLSVGWGFYESKEENSAYEFEKFMKSIDDKMYVEKLKKHRKKK